MKSEYSARTALALITAILVLSASSMAAKEKVIYRFKAGTDGANPYGSLIADAAGNLYGTTGAGGDATNCSAGCGTVFRLSPPAMAGLPWIETILYRFHGVDGAAPEAALIFDQAGNLYGTTQSGGGGIDGVVFELSPPTGGGQWTETVLYRFNGNDGEYPLAPLVFDSVGNLFGTTFFGGPSHMGVAFELSPPKTQGDPWTESTLFQFGNTDGMPNSALLVDASSALYGTNFSDSVFKLTPPAPGQTSWTKTLLHKFGGNGDGIRPCGLLANQSGALYGVTALGGGPANAGTVYQLVPPTGRGGWTENILYMFANGADGGVPCANLIADQAGNLYGTAYAGGISGNGTVFKMSPPAQPGGAWTETTLYQFKGAKDGANPSAAVILGKDGRTLYGTTVSGGKTLSSCDQGSCGTVFQIKP